MTIQEILEVHVVEVGRNVFTREEWPRCKCGWIGARVLVEGFDWEPAKRDHVAEVLDEAMWEREAEAVRASARYIERLYTLNGPINKADVLADLEVAADRLSRGLHAN